MPSNTNAEIGNNLRTLRQQAGLSARNLAKAAGITHSHLLRIETGERRASQQTLDKLTAACLSALQQQTP